MPGYRASRVSKSLESGSGAGKESLSLAVKEEALAKKRTVKVDILTERLFVR